MSNYANERFNQEMELAEALRAFLDTSWWRPVKKLGLLIRVFRISDKYGLPLDI